MPDLIGALVVKAPTAQRSARQRDRTDVEHLQLCAAVTRVELPAPMPDSPT